MGRTDPHASVFEKATDRMPTPYDFWALKDVSFEIKQGDVVGVMGRNGSGKSTLLKILSRITAPTSGRAFLKGRLASLLEVGTGFNYELTGKENVYLNGSILGLKKAEIDARYDNIVEFAEISDFMDTPVKRYSSGMRVRLAFAVAAHLEPDILILDEVLAVGDAKFQNKCLNRIQEIRNSGVTVLFVSHSAEQVIKLCNKGIILQEGKIISMGSALETTTEYLKCLGIEDHQADGGISSRSGLFAAKTAEFFVKYLHNGKLVVNAPVETDQGIIIVPLGWVEKARLQTLRTQPTWSAAPDIVVKIIDKNLLPDEAHRMRMKLCKCGAVESWIIQPDGRITRFSDAGVKPLFGKLNREIYVNKIEDLIK
jgi:ABC-type polysaccharide/polyol phosphate transport system ATPase subunit